MLNVPFLTAHVNSESRSLSVQCNKMRERCCLLDRPADDAEQHAADGLSVTEVAAAGGCETCRPSLVSALALDIQRAKALAAGPAVLPLAWCPVSRLGCRHDGTDFGLNGWGSFVCPCCGRNARVLRLLWGAVVHCRCCTRRGVRPRCEPMSLRQRVEHRVPKFRAMLESEVSLRAAAKK
jgi:hypothetical protein